MSALDVLRSFAEAREAGHVVINGGITYRCVRDALADFDRCRALLADAVNCLDLDALDLVDEIDTYLEQHPAPASAPIPAPSETPAPDSE